MSAHISWVGADRANVEFCQEGDVIGSFTLDAENAFLIGNGDDALVVEGSPDELRAFGAKVAQAVAMLSAS